MKLILFVLFTTQLGMGAVPVENLACDLDLIAQGVRKETQHFKVEAPAILMPILDFNLDLSVWVYTGNVGIELRDPAIEDGTIAFTLVPTEGFTKASLHYYFHPGDVDNMLWVECSNK